LVARHSEIWQASMEAANEKWSQAARDMTGQIRDGLGQALDQSLTTFAQRLAQVEGTAAGQVQERWEQWQTALSSNARLMQSQQQEISRQSELMARVVEATGDVLKLETALNHNLKSLAGAKNFEDTVMSLAAAIHLLNIRLGGSESDVRQIDLGPMRAQGRAA
jgi:DNA anti-recombination protein RmuC